jgi:UPF0271 protein
LYNSIARDEKSANLFIHTVKKYMNDVFLYVPYNSVIEKVALQHHINIKYEAFGDRNYNDDLTLVARSAKNALITDRKEVFNHVLNILKTGKVKTISTLEGRIEVDTFCIHGDTENAIEIVKYLFKNLQKEGFRID